MKIEIGSASKNAKAMINKFMLAKHVDPITTQLGIRTSSGSLCSGGRVHLTDLKTKLDQRA
jgi:hypothetical protein